MRRDTISCKVQLIRLQNLTNIPLEFMFCVNEDAKNAMPFAVDVIENPVVRSSVSKTVAAGFK